MPLLLVQAFVNTRDIEEGADLLGDRGMARVWLIAAGLLPREAPLTDGDLAFAGGIRESIRSLLESNGGRGVGTEDLEPLRLLADTRRPRLAVGDDGVLALESTGHENLADGLFELLLIIRGAQEEGAWSRLKVCSNPDCRWAYYDRSRNQQGNWCNMAVCGNRLKNRQLRARRS